MDIPGALIEFEWAPGDIQGGLNRYVNLTEKRLLPYACQVTPRYHKNLNHICMRIQSVSFRPVVLSGCPGFFPGALLTFNGVAGDVQGSLDENVMLWVYVCVHVNAIT